MNLLAGNKSNGMQVLVDTSGGPFTRELLVDFFGIHEDQIVPHVRGLVVTYVF